jgi:hypothetical protein
MFIHHLQSVAEAALQPRHGKANSGTAPNATPQLRRVLVAEGAEWEGMLIGPEEMLNEYAGWKPTAW